MELHERLQVFFERLNAAPAVATADEALALVCRLIEEVEDEFCMVPREAPPPMHRTWRMYPPQSDHIFPQSDGSIRAETRRHTMFFAADGSIRIVLAYSGEVEISKLAGKI